MMCDPQAELTVEMGADETLVWSGKPKNGIVFRGCDIFMIPFSILWCGFAIFWEVAASGLLFLAEEEASTEFSPFNFIFPLFGLLFVAVGLYLVFGRFLVDKAQREKTSYGISNERVIIKSGLFSTSVKSLNLRTLSDITLKEHRDGSGTITLGTPHPFAMFQGMTWWPGPSSFQVPSFEGVPDVRKVYELIREQQRK